MRARRRGQLWTYSQLRLQSVNLNELIEDINGDNKVLLGGPVQPDTLHFLHRHVKLWHLPSRYWRVFTGEGL